MHWCFKMVPWGVKGCMVAPVQIQLFQPEPWLVREKELTWICTDLFISHLLCGRAEPSAFGILSIGYLQGHATSKKHGGTRWCYFHWKRSAWVIQEERIVIITQLIAVRLLKGSFIGKGIIQPTVLCIIILNAVQDIFLPLSWRR